MLFFAMKLFEAFMIGSCADESNDTVVVLSACETTPNVFLILFYSVGNVFVITASVSTLC